MHENNEAVGASQDAMAWCHWWSFGCAEALLGGNSRAGTEIRVLEFSDVSDSCLSPQHHWEISSQAPHCGQLPQLHSRSPSCHRPLCSTALPCPVDLCHLSSITDEVYPTWPYVRQLLAMPGLLPKSAHTVVQIGYPILMMLLKPFGKLLRSSKALGEQVKLSG